MLNLTGENKLKNNTQNLNDDKAKSSGAAVVINPVFRDGKRIRMMFGDGQILVSKAHIGDDYNNILVLAYIDKAVSPIGADLPEFVNKRSDEIGEGQVVELEFKNVESVQVVIDALLEIKNIVGEKQGL